MINPISDSVPPTYEWIGWAVVLAGALVLRGTRRKWPVHQDLLDVLFLFGWVCWVLFRLNLYFHIEAELPQGNPWRPGIAATVLWVTPVFFLKGIWRRVYAASLVTAAIALAVGDILSFRRYATLLSPDLWPTVSRNPLSWERLADFSSQVSMRVPGWLLAEAAVVGLLLPRRFPDLSKAHLRIRRRTGWVILGCAALLMGAKFVAGFQRLYAAVEDNNEAAYIRQWGIWNHHVFLVLRGLNEFRERHLTPPGHAASLVSVKQYLESNPPISRTRRRSFGAARGYNLILVYAESLQQFVVGSQVLGQEVTPFLNAWRKNSMHFTRFFSQIQDGASSDGEYIAMTSLHPLARGPIVLRKLDEALVALPQVLRQYRYTTFSAHPFFSGYWNELSMHKRYGFQESWFIEDLGKIRKEDRQGMGMADESFIERIVPAVRQLPRPFFAYLICSGIHHRLGRFPDHLRYLKLGPMDHTRLGSYLQAMREFDYALSLLVNAVQQSDLRDNTVIAVYGDVESRMDVKGPVIQAFLGLEGLNSDSSLLFSRVPFFIHLPRDSMRGEIRSPGGQIDVAPTLLGLLGIEPPPVFLGRSLVDSPPGVVAFQNESVFSEKLGFIPRDPARGEPACFDIPTGSTTTLSACDGMRQVARRQLDASDSIHQYNLAPELNATRKAP